MDNFVIWTPEREGHAPDNWEDGMLWAVHYSDGSWSPFVADPYINWNKSNTYRVPYEAVHGPFDPDAWLAQGRAHQDKLPDGVVLPEVKDWALEAFADAMDAWGNSFTASRVRLGLKIYDNDTAAIAVIRERCQPREKNDG